MLRQFQGYSAVTRSYTYLGSIHVRCVVTPLGHHALSGRSSCALQKLLCYFLQWRVRVTVTLPIRPPHSGFPYGDHTMGFEIFFINKLFCIICIRFCIEVTSHGVCLSLSVFAQ